MAPILTGVYSVAISAFLIGRSTGLMVKTARQLASERVESAYCRAGHPRIEISSIKTALVAALVIGLINSTLGLFLKIVTFPLTLVSLGVFWFVINAMMLKVATLLVSGFRIDGLLPAFFGAIVLSLVNVVLRAIAGRYSKDD